MCLTIYNDKDKKPRVATKEIVVYKAFSFLVDNVGYTPCRGARYVKGNIFTSKLDEIRPGYFPKIERGLHSCLTRHRAKDYGYYVVKMIIPKGAYYYIGDENEIASDILIWT